MIIVNGRTGSDREIGELTFNSKKGSSTIDYCVASPDFFPHIQDFHVDILDKNLSDKHSPIILTLETKHMENLKAQSESTQESDIEYERISSKWDDNKKQEFQSNFDQNKIYDFFQILETIDTKNTGQTEINNLVKEISNISINAGIKTNISKKNTGNAAPKNNPKANKPWFDHECQEKRRHFVQLKRRLLRRKIKTQNDTETLNNEAKLYKNFIRMKINHYNKNLHDKLRNLKTNNSKEYWDILNPKKHQANNSISLGPLYAHFKAINDQPVAGNRSLSVDDIPDGGDEILNNDFTLIEIYKLSNKLKNNKSSAIDNVINEFLKYSPEIYKKTHPKAL